MLSPRERESLLLSRRSFQLFGDAVNPPPNRSCVYTCLVGRYEKLNEQPMARQSAVPFICLTDDPDLTSDTWRIVRIDPLFAQDSVRSQRMLKLLPHRYLGDFERSLYIDNAVVLTAPPERLFADYLDTGFALPSHSYRTTVRDEFAEVAATQLDDDERIADQLASYQAGDPAALDERPYWSGLLLRDHGDARTTQALETWAMHVLRFSRRDQLSANYAFRRSGYTPRRIEIDNYASWFHRWPVIAERRQDIRVFHSTRADAEREVARLTHEANAIAHHVSALTRAVNARTDEVNALTQAVNTRTDELNAMRDRATAAEHDAAVLRTDMSHLAQMLSEHAAHVQHFLTSRSWKVTAPLRMMRRWLPSRGARLENGSSMRHRHENK